jgi:hypothetical protein
MLIASRPTSAPLAFPAGLRLPALATTKHSRGAPAPEFCSRTPRLLASRKKEGGGAPKGASSHCPRRAIRCCHLNALRARCPHPTLPRTRGRAGRGLASRRSAAALAKATERFGSAQAALRAKERAPALPAPSVALKRSTPHPGRSAGGDDARAARGLRIASKFIQFTLYINYMMDSFGWLIGAGKYIGIISKRSS